MKHRKLISLLLALAMLFALAACSGGGQEQNSPNTNSEQPSESPENSGGTEERTVTVTDMVRR